MPKPDKNYDLISVLIVEDVEESRIMLTDIIGYRYPGVQLFVADNGETGIETFNDHQPDIVITDINMPITDGLSMAAKIKTLVPSTEIVVLTAYGETQHLMRAIEIGVSNFIQKPVNTEKFFKVIDKLIALIRSEREIARQNAVIRQLHAELTHKTAELELANAALESYDYTVAHDLRAPMVTIGCYARKMLDSHGAALNDDGKKCLQVINGEITRMSGFVGALLKFSIHSRKHVDKKMTNLSGMVQAISQNLQAHAPQRQATFCIEEGLKGYCDPDLIRIVMENLLGNAWKYSALKDEVRIEFGTINMEADQVYFVRDNGAGFDSEESEKIFAPFQRLQGVGEIDGFGIGLATTHRIIQRHGGRIWAEGKKDQGATFYFTL